MKTIIRIFLILTVIFSVSSCKDIVEYNQDPNNPAEVSTATLMTGAQKKAMDFIYDVWFSGRQALPYAQYWAQRTYTEEDRYQIRESVNNTYFNTLYTVAGNLVYIEKLNTDAETKALMSVYGNNNNQIAAAKILKVWLMQIMADTWGGIPYSEAFKLNDGVVYPKYDDLNVLYAKFLEELNAAINMIDENEPAFTSGDIIYGGDASLWKKFGNSLKCRIALRLSKVDPAWKNNIAEAVASGVFTSNADNAVFAYSTEAPNECFFYQGFYVSARNDFSITKPFCDLLKGQRDTLNNKAHPWEGVIDPRMYIYTPSRKITIKPWEVDSYKRYGAVTYDAENDIYYAKAYIGLPYGLKSSNMNSSIRNASPNFSASNPLVLRSNFVVPFMTYPELCFILSEYNGFSAAEYEEGIRASIEYWDNLNVEIAGAAPLDPAVVDAYVAEVTKKVDAEAVSTQKYIHLYMYGTEAWAEYRRTGYPTTLLKPGEISSWYLDENADTIYLSFEPISDVKGDLPARVKYPTNESTLNGDAFTAAVAKLQDGTNNYYSKMFWDVRSASNPHPANK